MIFRRAITMKARYVVAMPRRAAAATAAFIAAKRHAPLLRVMSRAMRYDRMARMLNGE